MQAIIKESWKQTRRDDDKNQPRSVQPWFSDSYRRRFWLVEGQEDSFFRIYRENDGRTTKTNTWFSVAGSIDEVNALANKFTEEGTQNARLNADKLRGAIPRFEQGEDKRKRREYRQQRKAAWARPAPGFSLYEGRTRGKRARYTFDEDEDFVSDGTRRSTRNATPVDSGPVVTASGRQVKSRVGGMYGESLPSDQRPEFNYNSGEGNAEGDDSEDEMPATAPSGRPQRAARAAPAPAKSRERYDDDGMDTESDEAQDEGEEWSGDEDEPDDEESEGEMSEDDDLDGGQISDDEGDTQKSLVVQLRYRPKRTPVPPSSRARTPPQTTQDTVSNGVPTTNGFGGDATADERPAILQDAGSHAQPIQQQQWNPQQSMERPSIHNQPANEYLTEEKTQNKQQHAQPLAVGQPRVGAEVAHIAEPQPEPQQFQALQPVTNTAKPLTPPAGVPEMSTGVLAQNPVAEGQQPQPQYQPQAHAMDVS